MIIPYHHNPKFSVRPYNFRRVREHPFWTGNVFAGLGAHAGGEMYFDSSAGKHHLTKYGTWNGQWGGVSGEIGRAYYDCDNAAQNAYLLGYFTVPESVCMSMSCWMLGGSAIANEGPIQVVGGDGDVHMGLQEYAGDNKPRISVRNGSDIGNYRGGNDQIWSVTEWTFYAAIFNAGVVSTYVSTGSTKWDDSINRYSGVAITSIEEGGRFYVARGCTNYLLADTMVWTRALTLSELQTQANPGNVMLDGSIEPIPTNTYFLPIQGEAPPASVPYDIFQSAIID